MRKLIVIVIAVAVLSSCQHKQEKIRIDGEEYLVEGTQEKGIAKQYFPNGKLKATAELGNNEINGEVRKYYDNSKLYKSYFVKDGRMEGPYKIYYKKGELFEKWLYRDARKADTAFQYNPNGSLRARMTYNEKGMSSIIEFANGQERKYQLQVEKWSIGSRTTYQLSLNHSAKKVKFYVSVDGKLKLLSDTFYTTIVCKPHIIFIAKGITQYGNAFRLKREI